jgi:hypothetical protein
MQANNAILHYFSQIQNIESSYKFRRLAFLYRWSLKFDSLPVQQSLPL